MELKLAEMNAALANGMQLAGLQNHTLSLTRARRNLGQRYVNGLVHGHILLEADRLSCQTLDPRL
eukprot:8025539-Lingulodinium_polyedra.AAC.1